MRHFLLAAALLLPIAATAAPCEGIPGDQQVTVQLFYGRAIKGGGEVSADAWKTYMDTEVTPRFPAGLTVIEAAGQWQQRSTGKVISEKSTVIEIVTSPSPETWAKFEAVRNAYKAKFQQESVGLVTNLSCASW